MPVRTTGKLTGQAYRRSEGSESAEFVEAAAVTRRNSFAGAPRIFRHRPLPTGLRADVYWKLHYFFSPAALAASFHLAVSVTR
jgi:hypothetical protein